MTAAVEVLRTALDRRQLDRTRVVRALDTLQEAPPDDGAFTAAHGLARGILDGAFGEHRQADVLQRCVAVLARHADRRGIDVLRDATAVHVEGPHRDIAATLRGQALAALHALEPDEARYVAARLLGEGDRAASGEPATTAIQVLGDGGDDVALVLACNGGLRHDIPLLMAALQHLSPATPPRTFWEIAEPVVGDRFGDAVLAITDIIVEGRRSDLVPGFGDALTAVSDPDLMRAALMSLAGARLEGLDAAFAAVVDRAPPRALPGAADALDLARIASQQELLDRVQQRIRAGT